MLRECKKMKFDCADSYIVCDYACVLCVVGSKQQNWFGFATQRFCIPFQSLSHWFENFEFIYEKYNS